LPNRSPTRIAAAKRRVAIEAVEGEHGRPEIQRDQGRDQQDGADEHVTPTPLQHVTAPVERRQHGAAAPPETQSADRARPVGGRRARRGRALALEWRPLRVLVGRHIVIVIGPGPIMGHRASPIGVSAGFAAAALS
jgi:hypothetical protein